MAFVGRAADAETLVGKAETLPAEETRIKLGCGAVAKGEELAPVSSRQEILEKME